MSLTDLRSSVRWWRLDAAAVGACLLMTALLYFGGLEPLMAARDRTASRQKDLEAQREHASALAVSVSRARTQLHAVQEAIRQNPLKLQPSRLVNNRIAELTELANAHELEIEHIEPSPSRNAGRYEVVPLRVAGVGAFPKCVVFLHRLRQGFPDTGVAGFRLSGNPTAPGTGRFELELQWFAAPNQADGR